ncbi:hypothetical protein DB346_07620 [Verrucomicrobia bacterium LW23]|nr:hypothetical protein DB346_07620 [Verrucomicrobia bacterium LW23]
MHPPTISSDASESAEALAGAPATASTAGAASAKARPAWTANRLARVLALDLTVFACVATAALCIGILINQFRDRPAPWIYQSKADRLNQAVAHVASDPGAPAATSANTAEQPELPGSLGLAEFRRIVEQKQILVLDARPEIFHRLGHVPGALALPRDEFDIYYPKLQTILQPKTRPLVLYCASSSCEDSALVEKALRKLGYTNIAIFHGGWAEWTNARFPEEKQ